MTAASLGGFRFLGNFGLLRVERGLGLVEDGLETGLVFHREIGEDLAIEFDSGGFEAFHEAAVGQAESTGSRIDTELPKHAEIAFAVLPVAIGVNAGFHDRILGVTEELGTTAAEALGFLDDLLAPTP